MKTEDGIQITRLDPWMKGPKGDTAPGQAIYLGCYELWIERVITYTEALFLSGGPEELRRFCEDRGRRRVETPRGMPGLEGGG
jgi:hypothetical protein